MVLLLLVVENPQSTGSGWRQWGASAQNDDGSTMIVDPPAEYEWWGCATLSSAILAQNLFSLFTRRSLYKTRESRHPRCTGAASFRVESGIVMVDSNRVPVNGCGQLFVQNESSHPIKRKVEHDTGFEGWTG